ncbi:hypothetical protein EZZ76_10760 [Neisseria meningitidis]|uniref:hypothetical protein n=1 Tax=Neisseria meningitidis TaxID=487 RepID=UPI001DC7C67F|nr:hypothetical protein [Neisseria meningitidis]MBW7994759.1 hypothetical protein [Neisseria meningitidis]
MVQVSVRIDSHSRANTAISKPVIPDNTAISKPVIPAQAGIQSVRHGNLSGKKVSLDFIVD